MKAVSILLKPLVCKLEAARIFGYGPQRSLRDTLRKACIDFQYEMHRGTFSML